MESVNTASTKSQNWSDLTWKLDDLGVDLCLDDKLELKVIVPDGVVVPRQIGLDIAQFKSDLHRFILETDLKRAQRRQDATRQRPTAPVTRSSVFTD